MATRWRRTTTGTLLFVVGLIVVGAVGGWFIDATRPYTLLRFWTFTAAGLSLFTWLAGQAIVGRFAGALIDNRNRMSLARLQTVLWTILILSAWLAAVVWNVALGGLKAPNPAAIAIPEEVWWLLGISTTSLVGTPLILSTKKEAPGAAGKLDRQLARSGAALSAQRSYRSAIEGSQAAGGKDQPAAPVQREGEVVVLRDLSLASPADLFQGDEVGNAATLDLGKVQMFFFTCIAVLAYGLVLAATFRQGGAIKEFPALDGSLVALLGISHAGYLAHKAVPQSATASVGEAGGDQ